MHAAQCFLARLPLTLCGAGSLFAFEVLHRTGLQFYETIVYGVTTGFVCLLIFRGSAASFPLFLSPSLFIFSVVSLSALAFLS